MKVRRVRAIFLPAAAIAVLLGGCSKPGEDGGNANQARPPVVETVEEPGAIGGAGPETASPITDAWDGRWVGPEGLYLDIQPSSNGKPGHYAIQNKDTLDREGSYEGVAEGEVIRFSRDGKALTIRSGTGDETGFKYLAGKQECLIVVAGQEGYCR